MNSYSATTSGSVHRPHAQTTHIGYIVPVCGVCVCVGGAHTKQSPRTEGKTGKKCTDPTDRRHRATATRTGVGARGREDGRRADRETRKRHDARTSGWHPFEGVAGPSSDWARGSDRRGQRSLSRHVFLASVFGGNRTKRHAEPQVFAEIIESKRPKTATKSTGPGENRRPKQGENQ